MTTTIECTNCAAKFAGKPEYAGRRIKCPKCEEVFRVPSAAVSVAEEEPFDEWNVPADFEYKLQHKEEKASSCPYCKQAIAPEQVLCMNCGYHLELKQKIETKRGEEIVEPQPANPLYRHLDFGSFTVPVWPLAAAGGVAALFALILLFVAPVLLALLLLLVGFALYVAGSLWIVVIAAQESVLMALAVWFVPIFWWYYVISRIEDVWIPLGVTVAGLMMLIGGVVLLGSGEEVASVALMLTWAEAARG